MALAPHYSRISIGGYRKAVDAAQEALGQPFQIHVRGELALQPEFLDLIADHVRAALEQFPAERRGDVRVVFSAHSLPERIRDLGRPYEAQLLAAARRCGAALAGADWRFAWQSAGKTGEPWIGPDILDYLETLHAEGVRNVLQCRSASSPTIWKSSTISTMRPGARPRELGMTLRAHRDAERDAGVHRRAGGGGRRRRTRTPGAGACRAAGGWMTGRRPRAAR